MRSLPSCSLLPGLALALGLAGCAGPAAPGLQTGLAGTAWQLVQVQSMDDSQGSTSVADPSLYTLRFDAGSRVSLRLNCNRGSGSWSASPSADGRSGTLSLGPVAATRALCPPPSLDEKLARDLPMVRSYLLKDGRLHLSLQADGGIYTWAPLAP